MRGLGDVPNAIITVSTSSSKDVYKRQTYKTKDDRWIQLALIQYDNWFPKFAKEGLNAPQLLEDEDVYKRQRMTSTRKKM